MNPSKNVKLVLDILQDEIRGDVAAALSKMDKNYSMTWVYKSPKGVLFPVSKPDFAADMKEAYVIKDRKYDIKNIAEGENVVMVELVESYTDQDTNQFHQTPLTLVLEIKDGKILRGRHYCDPQVSYLKLDNNEIRAIFDK